jgi:hypothetical protein
MTEYHIVRLTYTDGKTRDQRYTEGPPPKFTMKAAQREFGRSVVKLEVIQVQCTETVVQTCEHHTV